MIRFIDISLAQLDHEVKGVLSRGYGTDVAELEEQMSTLCRMALTVMARSNSLFYSFEHTVMCAQVALQIIGSICSRHGFIRHPEALHILAGSLFSNVGIIQGLLQDDKKGRMVTGEGKILKVESNASDSVLWKYRTSRSFIYVERENILQNLLNLDVMSSAIDHSHISKLDNKTINMTDKYCRAVQIISLMAHPNYMKNLTKLYWSAVEGDAIDEFNERELGQFRVNFKDYFWNNLYTDASETIALLKETDGGRELVAALYAHL